MSQNFLGGLVGDLYGGQMPAAEGFQSPTMSGYGFNWYGGQPQIPEGGYYNQMAQAMAGPSYAPPGSNWYSGTPGQAPSVGSKGAIASPQAPSISGKGAIPGQSIQNAPVAQAIPGRVARQMLR